MKDLLKQALQKVHDFVNGHEDSIPEKSDSLVARLEEALARQKRQPYYSSVGYSKSNFRSFYYPNGPKKKI